jgi:hypothetical protein
MLFDTLAYTRGESSMLNFGEGRIKDYAMIPAIERRLMRGMKQAEGYEKEMLLHLVPDRVGAVIEPSRYDRKEIKNKALQELLTSDMVDASYAHDRNLTGDVVKAGILSRTGFSPYNFSVYPDTGQVGELLEKKRHVETDESLNYKLYQKRNSSPYLYMNSFKAQTIIRDYEVNEQRKKDWTERLW